MIDLFAVEAGDVLTGGGGWAASASLGSVLFWLFFKHLPAKDKQMETLIAAKDSQIDKLRVDKDSQIDALLNQKWAAISHMQTENKEAIQILAKEARLALEALTKHCDLEISRFCDLFEKKFGQQIIEGHS